MAVNLTPVLKLVGRSGRVRWGPQGLLRLKGIRQAVTTTDTTSAFLDLPDVTALFAERSALLGLDTFPLALDGPRHLEARQLVADALTATRDAEARGVADAAAKAEQLVRGAGDHLDVGGVVDAALAAWIETWYGLPGQGLTLARAGQMIGHVSFLNDKVPGPKHDAAALERAVDWVWAVRPPLAAAVADAAPGTVAATLLASTGDLDEATNHLLGLTVGPLALGGWSVMNVIDELLDAHGAFDAIENAADGEVAFDACLKRRPPLEGTFRMNPSNQRMVTGNRTVSVPSGMILVHTQCAMALDDDADAALAFGHGAHACLGRRQVTAVAGAVLHALAARSPLRAVGRPGRLRPGPGPSGIAAWPFPGSLLVDLQT